MCRQTFGRPTFIVQNQTNAVTKVTLFPAPVVTTTPIFTTNTDVADYEPSPFTWQSIDERENEDERSTEKRYDDKYNMDEDKIFEAEETDEEEERQKLESQRGMSPTMSLVIGIIIGSFTAMILIVIIVLKVQTGVDIEEYKQEQMQHYQFPSPSGPDREEFSNTDTASTSLIDNGHAVGQSKKGGAKHCNGNTSFFNGGLSTALTSDRAKLFKKANSYGRPVREWYV